MGDTLEASKRQEILGQLDLIVKKWVKNASLNEGFDKKSSLEQNAKIYSFGSYRLGIERPGSDIDIICVGPKHISREKYFFCPNHYSLESFLAQMPEVTKVVGLKHTYVPTLKFTFYGVSFDLLYANLPINIIHEDLDVKNSDILRGSDEITVKALNGCRTTDILLKIVPNHAVFLLGIKFIKQWGCLRGLDSNVFGYFGGVNWAICLAYTCILYPTACASRVIHRFFYTMYTFPWPQAMQLCEIQKLSLGFQIWDKWIHAENIMRYNEKEKSKKEWNQHFEFMPIRTPSYPAINSSFSVSLATREILLEEFKDAEKICQRILSHDLSPQTQWYQLLEPYCFFNNFKEFLLIDLFADNLKDLEIWDGLLHSKLRILVADIPRYMKVRPWPRAYNGIREDGGFKLSYYFGINKRKSYTHLKPSTYVKQTQKFKIIDASESIEKFIASMSKNEIKKDGMDMLIKKIKKQQIPKFIQKLESNSNSLLEKSLTTFMLKQ